MTVERNFHGPNLGYILELYDQFQEDPESLDASSRSFFQNWKPPLPKLVVHDRVVWRVPVIFSMAPHGDRGVVGEIDVDVETGATQLSQEMIEGMKQRAQDLALSSPSSATTAR